MAYTCLILEAGTMISAVGLAAIPLLDHSMETELGHGTTQAVMAIFIIMLAGCVVALFTILMKTISKGHQERDDREHRFAELVTRMELALHENTKASLEQTKSIGGMEAIGKECVAETVLKKLLAENLKQSKE